MKILFADPHLMIVDKPAGLPVLPDGWEQDAPYLVKLLEEQYGKIFIIHRLDKITSGVMVFARDAETHRSLSMQFESHAAQKIYHAVIEGNPKWDEKVTRFPLRVNVGHKHRTIVDDRAGKPSETSFKILKRYPAAALIEALPLTGRTHQIRVHAAALGHPLLGDLLYGAQASPIMARAALHAHTLTFTHPTSGEPVTSTAEYPPDFVTALKSLARHKPRHHV